MPKETLQFQAETQQVLGIMIHSLYTHPEIFLRELVSNASDAIDKLRFQALTRAELTGNDTEFRITLTPDKEKKTLTIDDNGIGMTRDEVVANIGTIARSGTREFAQRLAEGQKADWQMIGQFGVGFYSAFMVAARVTLLTRPADGVAGPGTKWESGGDGAYTVEEFEKPGRGTTVILHLKDEHLEFLDPWRIKQIVREYSDYVAYPIRLRAPAEGKKGEVAEETVNKSLALWRRPRHEVKDEEYNEFYKYLCHDGDDPLLHVHQTAEGTLEFRMLLYVPRHAPMDLYTRDYRGIRLYVKKMFVMDDCKDLIPPFLRFLRGVVDSEDLPLNISRQTLQANPVVARIRKQLVSSVLGALEKMKADTPEAYQAFYREFGSVLKEGVASHAEQREKIAGLLMFPTTRSPDGLVSLGDYVAHMKEGQTDIYYLTSLTKEALASSPHLEVFREKDIEVLLMSDPVDEWAVSALPDFDGKKLRSVAQGDLDLGAVAKTPKDQEREKDTGDFQPLCDAWRGELQDDVKLVRLSHRLSGSPCCLVGDEGDLSTGMEQIMRALHHEVHAGKKILEINPTHPVILDLRKKLADKQDVDGGKRRMHLLYEQCRLAQGLPLKNPAEFVRGVTALMEKTLG